MDAEQIELHISAFNISDIRKKIQIYLNRGYVFSGPYKLISYSDELITVQQTMTKGNVYDDKN
jgi:hypothetical protein